MQYKAWLLVKRPQGVPTKEDFKLVTEDLPPCQEGEVIIEAECLSVDPYLRYRTRTHTLNTPMFGGQVARVVESRNPKWPVGSYMETYAGWRTHTLLKPEQLDSQGFGGCLPLPDLEGLPNSLGLGVIGMPGNTAYFGLLELLQPKEGETVLVNGAAGAVGSAVVQIAKIKGCKVVAFAGTDEKVSWVKSLGADHVYNYKTTEISQALKEAAPKGVNCFFDNVGGEFSLEALRHMAEFGRVAICGAISTYNMKDEDVNKGPRSPYDATVILSKQLKVEGFLVYRWSARWMEGLSHMKDWVKQGKIQYKESVTKGFENMPSAFIGLFSGANTGKAIIKV